MDRWKTVMKYKIIILMCYFFMGILNFFLGSSQTGLVNISKEA